MDVEEEKFKQITDITNSWAQGDYVIGEFDFLLKTNPDHHIASEEELTDDDDSICQPADGFCIVTQTCDVVRNCSSRPYIEVCPLVEVSSDDLIGISKGKRPNYAYIQSLGDKGFAVDLDRVTTVEKSVLKGLEKTGGCSSDNEKRKFAKSLARKRSRFAFPNDFVKLSSNLMKRLEKKHDKDSPEGRALRALREIRVQASPSWDDNDIDLTFYFIREEEQKNFEGAEWSDHENKWMDLLPEEKGRYSNIYSEITTMEMLTAKEYVESDMLDLDRLSDA